MADLVRVAALTGYFRTMKSLGADPLPLLREVGVSRSLLSKPEQMISAHTVIQLLERSAEVTGCRTFGLRIAPLRGLADLGATSLLIEHEPTLRYVLSALSRYRNRINPILDLHIEDFGDGVLVRQIFSMSDADASRQATDLALSALARLCAMVVGENWHPELVCLTCEPPPSPALQIYERLFSCRVEFKAECNGIVIASSDLERPSQRADSALPNMPASSSRPPYPPRIRTCRSRLNSRCCFRSLRVAPPSRRVQRSSALRFAHCSVTSVWKAKASTASSTKRGCGLPTSIGNPRTRISDVAGILGYGSTSAFIRWHHQTYGMSPMDRRNISPQPGTAEAADPVESAG
jgi:AraC-like DNA-binding protein